MSPSNNTQNEPKAIDAAPGNTPSVPPADFKPRLKAAYDAIAPVYNTWTQQHDHFRIRYLDKLFSVCEALRDDSNTTSNSPPTLLELGCGAGSPSLSNVLTRHPTLRATGNDLSETQLSLAREKLASYLAEGRLTLEQGDMSALEFPDGSFDAVVAFYSIIHLPGQDQIQLLDRIYKWLRPGGCLLVNFPNGEMEVNVSEHWLHEDGWMFWSGLGVEQSVEAVRNVGLEVLSREVEGDEKEKFLWVIARKPA